MAIQTLDNDSLDTAHSVGPDEFPFYTQEEYAPEPKKEKKEEIWPNATTLAQYRLSRASAPVPNTIVPADENGLFPSSTMSIPLSGVAGVIYSRDGLRQYQLVVEDNGALSLDPL